MIFPWQDKQWQQLFAARKANRLPHALLFAGITGTGKTHFTSHFVQALLCQNIVTSFACEDCHACRLVRAKTHPDVLWVEAEKAGQAIKIDQIRSVTQFIYQTSWQGQERIVIIPAADQMNTYAANALLKILEEPPKGVLLILISGQPSHLPATILSRCQRLHFPAPLTAEALPWLQEKLATFPNLGAAAPNLLLRLTQGAPLAALKWLEQDRLASRLTLFRTLLSLAKQEESPIERAVSLGEIDNLTFLDLMMVWVLDLLRLQLGGGLNTITNIDFAEELKTLSQARDQRFMTFLQYLQPLRGEVYTGINLNKQLLMENVLIRYQAIHFP